MQQVLIQLLRACWNIVDVSNNKFDKMISILALLFNHLKEQAPTIEAYDALTKQMNTRFKKVFDKLSVVRESSRLTSEVRPSDARVGEGSKMDQTIPWKTASEFNLWDESNDDDLQILSIGLPSDDDDEEVEYITNDVVGIQAPRKFSKKILSKEEKRIWFASTWPSSLTNVLQRSREMDQKNTSLKIEAFRATQSMSPPIPSPRKVPIDEGSPFRKPENIP